MARRSPNRVSIIILVVVVVVNGFAAHAPATQAAGPDLRLRPNDGIPGTPVVARGRDFAADSNGTIRWDDETELATFTTNADGDFEVTITIPDVSPGDYRVHAVVADLDADDGFTVEEGDASTPVNEASQPAADLSATPPVSPAIEGEGPCADDAVREVPVANAAELTEALADATPGERIVLANGHYVGNFVAETSGAAADRIRLCGSREAILAGGGWEHSGYALHITGSFWTVSGISVTNAQKGVMLNGAQSVVLDHLDVHTIGH